MSYQNGMDPEAAHVVEEEEQQEEDTPLLQAWLKVQSVWHSTTSPVAAHPAWQSTQSTMESVRRASIDGARSLTLAVGEQSRSISLATQATAMGVVAGAKQSLASIGSSPLERQGDGEVVVKGEGTDGLVTRPWIGVVEAVSSLAFVSAIVSMVLVVGHLVDLASVSLLVISPLAFWQRRQLCRLGGLRAQHNKLRANVNRFHEENAQLTTSVDQLSTHVQSLQHVEADLQAIADQSSTSLERLVNTVHEHGETQTQMRRALLSDVLQDIMTTILSTDRDKDFTVDPDEVHMLLLRLKSMPGIVLDEKRFHQFMADDRGALTLADVCKIARNLQDEKVPDSKRIIRIDPKLLLPHQ